MHTFCDYSKLCFVETPKHGAPRSYADCKPPPGCLEITHHKTGGYPTHQDIPIARLEALEAELFPESPPAIDGEGRVLDEDAA